MPNVTDPSLLTSGVSQVPPEPRPTASTPESGPRRVLNLHSSSPLAALSARSTPPPGPEPYALARYNRPSATCGWISNVPWPLLGRWLLTQILRPVRALSAKDRCRRDSAHHSAGDRDAVRSRSGLHRRIELVLPLQLAGSKRQRVHVRVEILDIDDAVHHDRICGQGTVRADACCRGSRDVERPGLLEPRHVC